MSASLATSWVQPAISSEVKGISGREIRRSGRGYMNQNFSSASSFKNISQEVLNNIKDKSITHNIIRIQYNDSIMCRFYCITFIEYMLARKTLFN